MSETSKSYNIQEKKHQISVTVALKCYRCGKYTPDGAGSVIPCYTYNQTDLKECRSKDKYCLKYLNEGIVVRDCVYECTPGVHELSEFFCCEEDGCNTAPTPKRPEWTIFLVAIVHLVLWMRYLT
ncbi:uncharacterized protein CDAR_405131 [Caerostris darwini]|uniref:Uncharacterized protein n=1 Tax=Caerostris darwini TaxID=1538125 RepID=A0AAV4U6X5_9ARAC|nr:uncharacterized protein CDAR_405131 [Caerostris darwini]